ncbi:MAG: hypothetical protein GXZ05_09465 [Gammaproteobacteria bacterium]|nr:hypothetical protein [Gammaproteobacteria bacterium]
MHYLAHAGSTDLTRPAAASIWPVQPVHKTAGTSAQTAADGRLHTLRVTGADDPQVSALLLETWLAL